MIRFNCDYSEGAHPNVLKKLIQTNLEQTAGYGEDAYCQKAAELIREKCGRSDLAVHFMIGGTQTNLTVISAALRPHQGAVAPETGHINTHESGAIEATGHKVLALPETNGKITAKQIQTVCDEHYNDANYQHMVQPKLVYLSFPTEVGTIYSKAELSAISETCKKNNLYLYIDGARLAYGLCAQDNDLDLSDFAQLCDAFYIGGTKVGTLFGEALVICNNELKQDFRYLIKQKGGMLAKGRLLGVQFQALLEDNLYFKIGNHAVKMAMLIRDACVHRGFSFLNDSTTNQQFPIMPNAVLEKLKKNYEFAFWQKVDEQNSVVRFCTSWATNEQDVQQLANDIEQI